MPRGASRPSSACSTSTVARASASARCSGVVVAWNSPARVLSLWLGASSRVTTRRASRTVSTTGKPGHACPVSAAAALRNPTSNGALCATSTDPRANSRNEGSTSAIFGAPITIAVVIPVSTWICAGTGPPGSTSVWNSPSTSPPRTLTAPTSVMADAPGAAPVVSRSTTTNVTSCSGVPMSSSVTCTGRPVCGAARSTRGGTGDRWTMRRTLTAPSDTPAPSPPPNRAPAPARSPPEPAPDAVPEAVRAAVLPLAAEVLGALDPVAVPASLAAVRRFAPRRRVTSGAGPLWLAVERDDAFRARVARAWSHAHPDLAADLLADPPGPGAPEDRLDLAVGAALLRPDGWAARLSALETPPAGADAPAQPDADPAHRAHRAEAELRRLAARLTAETEPAEAEL